MQKYLDNQLGFKGRITKEEKFGWGEALAALSRIFSQSSVESSLGPALEYDIGNRDTRPSRDELSKPRFPIPL